MAIEFTSSVLGSSFVTGYSNLQKRVGDSENSANILTWKWVIYWTNKTHNSDQPNYFYKDSNRTFGDIEGNIFFRKKHCVITLRQRQQIASRNTGMVAERENWLCKAALPVACRPLQKLILWRAVNLRWWKYCWLQHLASLLLGVIVIL